jgi:hypothetical protein
MRQTQGQENISTSKMNKEDKEMIFKKTTRRGTISGVRLKRDYPLFYRHETFAKCLITSQGANIPGRERMEHVRQGTKLCVWYR